MNQVLSTISIIICTFFYELFKHDKSIIMISFTAFELFVQVFVFIIIIIIIFIIINKKSKQYNAVTASKQIMWEYNSVCFCCSFWSSKVESWNKNMKGPFDEV